MSASERPSQIVKAAAELKALVRGGSTGVALSLASDAGDRRAIARSLRRPAGTIALGRSIGRRGGILGLEIVAGLVVITLTLMATMHARLSQGPIDVSYLVSPIERAINSQLYGLRVEIGGAVLRYEDGASGARFRLRDIVVIDATGARVAEAPFAGISLSGDALLAGHFAPAGISLIEPRVLVSYSDDEGLALSIDAAAGSAAATAAEDAVNAGAAAPSSSQSPLRIDLAQSLTKALEASRQQRGASYFLTRIGLEKATLVLRYRGSESTWFLPEFSVSLTQKRQRSLITGSGIVAAARGPWQFSFSTEDNEQKQSVSVIASFANVVLKDLAEQLSGLEVLKGFNVATDGDLRIEMARNGDVAVVEASAHLAAGEFDFPGNWITPTAIEDSLLQVRYSRQENKLEVLPSVIRTATSRASIVGLARPRGSDMSAGWDYSLRFLDVAIGDERFGLEPTTIDSWTAKGSYEPATGLVVVEQMRIDAGEARIALTGQMSDSTGLAVDVSASKLSTGLFQRLWPAPLGGYARDWTLENLRDGEIQSATMKVAFSPADLATIGKGGAIPDNALSAQLFSRGIVMRYAPKLPPLLLAEASAQIVGQKFTARTPTAKVRLPSGSELPVSGGSFQIDDITNELPQAVVHFEVAGTIDGAAEYLESDGMGLGDRSKIARPDVDGSARGTFDIALPLLNDVTWRDMTVRGKTRLSALSAPHPFGAFHLQGGTIDVDVSEKAVEAAGDLLINGVATQLKWLRLFGGADGKQPPLHLSASLDNADREQLGIAINHFISGDVPVEVTITPVAAATPDISVTADLTAAELILENMAWRKPPGQSAVVQFDVIPQPDKGFALADLKIAGDDIAIKGTAVVGPDNRLRSFDFPSFSFNVITQMEIAGTLGDDNVWKVKARGTTFDGRQLFRSFFSAGKLSDSDLPSPKSEAGIDLHAVIGSMIGYSDTSVREVNVTMKRRNGRLSALDGRGVLDGGKPIAVSLSHKPGEPRYLLAESGDAGKAFKLIGFYAGVVGGQASLKVDLDGKDGREKTGILWTRNFSILGNKVTEQVIDANNGHSRPAKAGKQTDRYSLMQFERMRVPFSVGYGQLAIYDSYINGSVIGATLRGKVDFNRQQVQLGGTYIPLYGLNSAIGGVPILGDILVGRTGEGVLGITFAIHGPLSEPEVTVNPVSAVAPGVFRQMFDFYQSPTALTPDKPRKKTDDAQDIAAIAAEASSSAPQVGDDDLGPSLMRAPDVAIAETVEPDAVTAVLPLPARNPRRSAAAADSLAGSPPKPAKAKAPKVKVPKVEAPAPQPDSPDWSTSSSPD